MNKIFSHIRQFFQPPKQFGYLAGKKMYLSGAIEHGDAAANWRTAPKQVLTSEFGINVFDPFDDPKQQWVEDLDKAQAANDLLKMKEISTKFVRKDLAIVDRTDFLIANLIYKLPTTGTVHEIINSNNFKKPTLLVCEKGAQFIPKWYFGFIPLEFMFGSWEALYAYLREVDAGLHKDNDRWDFVYDLI